MAFQICNSKLENAEKEQNRRTNPFSKVKDHLSITMTGNTL
jgi:hypothetical protein